MRKRRLTGLFTLHRLRLARFLGLAKHRSGFALCGVLLHHILPALVLLRKPLFGLTKHQLPRTLCVMWGKMFENIKIKEVY